MPQRGKNKGNGKKNKTSLLKSIQKVVEKGKEKIQITDKKEKENFISGNPIKCEAVTNLTHESTEKSTPTFALMDKSEKQESNQQEVDEQIVQESFTATPRDLESTGEKRFMFPVKSVRFRGYDVVNDEIKSEQSPEDVEKIESEEQQVQQSEEIGEKESRTEASYNTDEEASSDPIGSVQVVDENNEIKSEQSLEDVQVNENEEQQVEQSEEIEEKESRTEASYNTDKEASSNPIGSVQVVDENNEIKSEQSPEDVQVNENEEQQVEQSEEIEEKSSKPSETVSPSEPRCYSVPEEATEYKNSDDGYIKWGPMRKIVMDDHSDTESDSDSDSDCERQKSSDSEPDSVYDKLASSERSPSDFNVYNLHNKRTARPGSFRMFDKSKRSKSFKLKNVGSKMRDLKNNKIEKMKEAYKEAGNDVQTVKDKIIPHKHNIIRQKEDLKYDDFFFGFNLAEPFESIVDKEFVFAFSQKQAREPSKTKFAKPKSFEEFQQMSKKQRERRRKELEATISIDEYFKCLEARLLCQCKQEQIAEAGNKQSMKDEKKRRELVKILLEKHKKMREPEYIKERIRDGNYKKVEISKEHKYLMRKDGLDSFVRYMEEYPRGHEKQ